MVVDDQTATIDPRTHVQDRPFGAAPATAQERILEAAVSLMATKAPSQIAGRELAKKADVNYGLIHRHFGSKNNACKEAFQRLAGSYVEQARRAGDRNWLLTLGLHPEYRDLWRILAHAAMDSDSLAILGWDYPLLREQLAVRTTAVQRGDDAAQTKAALATAFSLAFGWTVFQPFLVQALELNDEDRTFVDAAITEQIQKIW